MGGGGAHKLPLLVESFGQLMARRGGRIRFLHRHDIGRLVICHDMIIQTLNVQNKLVTVKTAREKFQDRYKGKSIRITPNFSMEKPENVDGYSSISERPQMLAQTMIPSKTINHNQRRNTKHFTVKANLSNFL